MGGGARVQFTCRQVDGGAGDILDLRYLICCLLMSHWDVCPLSAGRGGAVEVFVSLRLITSWSFSAGQGPASGGKSDPEEGKCLGGCKGGGGSGYLWIPLKTEHPCSGLQVRGGGRLILHILPLSGRLLRRIKGGTLNVLQVYSGGRSLTAVLEIGWRGRRQSLLSGLIFLILPSKWEERPFLIENLKSSGLQVSKLTNNI